MPHFWQSKERWNLDLYNIIHKIFCVEFQHKFWDGFFCSSLRHGWGMTCFHSSSVGSDMAVGSAALAGANLGWMDFLGSIILLVPFLLGCCWFKFSHWHHRSPLPILIDYGPRTSVRQWFCCIVSQGDFVNIFVAITLPTRSPLAVMELWLACLFHASCVVTEEVCSLEQADCN